MDNQDGFNMRPWEPQREGKSANDYWSMSLDYLEGLDCSVTHVEPEKGLTVYAPGEMSKIPPRSYGEQEGKNGDYKPSILFFASERYGCGPDRGPLHAIVGYAEREDGTLADDLRFLALDGTFADLWPQVLKVTPEAVVDLARGGWRLGAPRLVSVARMCGSGDVTELVAKRLASAFIRRANRDAIVGNETDKTEEGRWTASPPYMLLDFSGITSIPVDALRAVMQMANQISGILPCFEGVENPRESGEVPTPAAHMVGAIVPDSVPDAVTDALAEVGMPVAVSSADMAAWLECDERVVTCAALRYMKGDGGRNSAWLHPTDGNDAANGLTLDWTAYAGKLFMMYERDSVDRDSGGVDMSETKGDATAMVRDWLGRNFQTLADVLSKRRVRGNGIIILDADWRTGRDGIENLPATFV